MKIICSWCKKVMGEKTPYSDLSETHGKCAECLKKQTLESRIVKSHNIDAALKKLDRPIVTYCLIQETFLTCTVSKDRAFQRRFNGFYRVRRSPEWQKHFYQLMEKAKKQRLSFAAILNAIKSKTGRLEPSFASKLVATVDPSKPVIDQHVLKIMGLKIPAYGKKRRQEEIIKMYEALGEKYQKLMSARGKQICARFNHFYPDAANKITDLKKVDFILWQSR